MSRHPFPLFVTSRAGVDGPFSDLFEAYACEQQRAVEHGHAWLWEQHGHAVTALYSERQRRPDGRVREQVYPRLTRPTTNALTASWRRVWGDLLDRLRAEAHGG